jgi:predicted ATPase
MPNETYVARSELNLESKLEAAIGQAHKLITVTGSTKSGKTVLVNRISPRPTSVWVDCGAVSNEDDFWSTILHRISGFTAVEGESSVSSAKQAGAEASVEGEIPLTATGRGALRGSFRQRWLP